MMTLNYNEKDFQKKLQKDIEMPEIVHEHINQAYRLIENNAVLQKKASKDPYHWMKSGGRIAGGMAAVLAVGFVFCAINPVMAKNIPVVGGLFEILQDNVSFLVCGMCEFRKPGFLEQAKELIAKGFKAIKIPAQRLLLKEGRVMLNNEEMMQMFHYMEERNVMLSVDLADGATQVPEMEEIIQECSRLKIAVGHFGMVTRPDWKEQIRLARHPNVMIESGGITWLFNDEFYPFKGAVKAIREAADLVGMEKLMWGSDYPRTITAITYKMSYDFVLKSTELTENEKRLFLGENARDFYGFTDLPVLPYIKNMSE